ncbi:MAG: hypothetical protein GXP34_01065 [Actinobacteria bacterium]|nr:hypothetical protein [Actinomycetota bacterium]
MGRPARRSRGFVSVEAIREYFLPELERERRRADRTPEEIAQDDADRIIRRIKTRMRRPETSDI